ncbi:MAG TPA: hypothetical protein DIU00_20375 [Phycisphaerales bacterium]|nr:hypothetical protein [Phycisphaerales bacterium]
MSIVPMLTARKLGYHNKAVMYAARAYFGRKDITNTQTIRANVKVTLCIVVQIRPNLWQAFSHYRLDAIYPV